MILLKLKNLFTSEPTKLETELDRILEKMEQLDPSDTTYVAYADQLSKLYKLKEVDSKKRVSSDAVLSAATNLTGILLIINYEYAHVLGSRAVSFIGKKIGS